MRTIKEALINLLKVKSLWSLMAGAMFIFLTVTGGISGEIALSIITAIVTYYFTKGEEKNADTEVKDNDEG